MSSRATLIAWPRTSMRTTAGCASSTWEFATPTVSSARARSSSFANGCSPSSGHKISRRRLACRLKEISTRQFLREIVRAQIRRCREFLDLLVEPLVSRHRDTPLAADLDVLVAVERGAGGADLVGEIDEYIRECPSPFGGRIVKHIDLWVMTRVA